MFRLAITAALFLLSGCTPLQGEPLPHQSSVPPLIPGAARKLTLVAFGYTSCPADCPNTLSRMSDVYRSLGDHAPFVTMAFVSVDPDRDDPSRLQAYVTAFDSRIIPVRLTAPGLRRTLAAYKVAAHVRAGSARLPSGEHSAYLIDHTHGFQVVDAAGRLRLRLPAGMAEADITADLVALLDDGIATSDQR